RCPAAGPARAHSTRGGARPWMEAPLRQSNDALDSLGEPRPALLLARELPASAGGERIESGFAVLLADAPCGPDPARLLHPVERRVERSLFDSQEIGGDALDVRRDGVAVHALLRGQGLEHEQHQRALNDVVSLCAHPRLTYLAMPVWLGRLWCGS